MASVKRVTHKNGRVVYRIVICMGYDKQGGKMVRSLTYSVNQSATPRQQEREALKYALEMEDKIKYGHDFCAENMSFEDFAGKWLESVRNNLSFGTYVGYEQLLRSRILPYFKSYKITHIKTVQIEAFYRTLEKEYSIGTIRRYANVMNCIFGTARRWDLLENNPCQGARKPQRKKGGDRLKYFTPDQSLMFLKSLNLEYEAGDGIADGTKKAGESAGAGRNARVYRVSMQFKVFFTLALFCGFRKGEILALHWNDIDFERQEISITKSIGKTEAGFDYKEPKNAASTRTVPFPDRVFSLLREYREKYDGARERLGDRWRGDGNLFTRADGRLMGQSTAYQYFTRHLRRYNQWVEENPEKSLAEGLEKLPVIPLHGLRHSCATLLNFLDVNIVDISKYLGHTSCSTTMNIYAHSFEAQKKAAQEKLNVFLDGKIS
ncbi:MAG: site-specific integrase [Roseburia sp.]|nr:site-specific integrase [Roseburia sp.]MCM1099733.1 site-specific integrase [Ruminococcus flavefaciens]